MNPPAARSARPGLGHRLALQAPEKLRKFNQAEVLDPVDVHAAMAVSRLLHEDNEDVLLAAALAVRGARLGNVCISLPDRSQNVVVDGMPPEKLRDLEWPEPAGWLAAIAASPLCGRGEPERPLVLRGAHLYLQRHWAYEQDVAAALSRLASEAPVAGERYTTLLTALVPDVKEHEGQHNLQRIAAAMAATQRLTVIAGGPGTGKTFTVARLLAVLFKAAEDSNQPLPSVALAAPTGKAATRVTEQLRLAARDLDLPPDLAEKLRKMAAETIHRLLGHHPARGRFRHGPDDPLPHDLVILDEVSMVSLPLAAKLLAALKPDARLVLVGDPNQLVSIEAGSVLADLVGEAEQQLQFSPDCRHRLESLAGPLPLGGTGGGFGDCVAVLDHGLRQQKGSGIPELADAIRQGCKDRALAELRKGWKGLTWLTSREQDAEQYARLTQTAKEHAQELARLGREGDAVGALKLLERVAVLCAHRRGPTGVYAWIDAIERAAELRSHRRAEWYPGRPVMVTANDYTLGLFNGDIGVTITLDGKPMVAFPGLAKPVGPARLANVETVHALTIHKSQGSEWDEVVILLPWERSPLLTRQLLYTAITRAKTHVTLVGTEAVIRAAIDRKIERASGLKDLVWGPKAGPKQQHGQPQPPPP